ncbi:MAG: nucleoside:proton symporter [Deltaproteobacteria bacterium]|nr:nucleoside:proton symporter [Deltaproteobacteria bacterium]
MLHLQSGLGIVVLIVIAWAFSENRRKFQWRIVAGALALQLIIAFILLKSPRAQALFQGLNAVTDCVQRATQAGTSMVFGFAGGGAAPFVVANPEHNFILAFQALPIILVVSVLSSLLYHWRILPLTVKGFSFLIKKTTGISGAVGLGVAANIFVGMVEAPLLVRPYVEKFSRQDMFVTMTAGMATIAGTVLMLYAFILSKTVPEALGHILTASIISAPSAILFAVVMVPGEPGSRDEKVEFLQTAESTMDALVKGVESGISLLINVVAMLIVLVALVALVNMVVGLVPGPGGTPMSLERFLGWGMAPVVWLTGIPWREATAAGQLMGIKTILNELIAYQRLAALAPEVLSERSRIIMTYCLCGFANFGSLGIMIGGLKTIAPERTREILSLGFKSILSGTLATLLTGCIVGVMI